MIHLQNEVTPIIPAKQITSELIEVLTEPLLPLPLPLP